MGVKHSSIIVPNSIMFHYVCLPDSIDNETSWSYHGTKMGASGTIVFLKIVFLWVF
jgi:hypothetical protein